MVGATRFRLIVALLAPLALASSGRVSAGAFIFAGGSIADAIAHPSGYDGSGPVVSVTVCVDPLTLNAASLRVPVRNVLSAWNALESASPNLFFGGANDIPSNAFDAQSILTHEIGHCIGLAHPNTASESGLLGSDQDYTKSEPGPNTVWNLDDGLDNVKGSCDDVRGDDVNLHWFSRASNNPFLPMAVVDSTTFSRSLADLPTQPAHCSAPGSGPHSFAANADRTVGALLGFPNTETVMQQGSVIDEDQRELAADDVSTMRYAMAGVDELAGTADDYVYHLLWGGLDTTGCDVVVLFDDSTGFAACSVGGVYIGPPANQHVAISSGTVMMNTGFNWYFDQDLACSLDIDGNDMVDPLTDALLLLRHLSGMSGSALTDGAIGGGATRTTPQAISAFIDGCQLPTLDVDGNGAQDAVTDTILLTRYLFGFRGSSLVTGAVGAGCTRCTAVEIEGLIASLFPQA
jgi:hypothetical protein